jgi:hypothetical protein
MLKQASSLKAYPWYLCHLGDRIEPFPQIGGKVWEK